MINSTTFVTDNCYDCALKQQCENSGVYMFHIIQHFLGKVSLNQTS